MARRSRRLFIELDCARLRAEPKYFRSAPYASVIALTVEWPSGQTTVVELAVDRVPLHFGGLRGYGCRRPVVTRVVIAIRCGSRSPPDQNDW
jgi:hypothetical protein